MDFKIGDVVKLKSGSPKMTISEIADYDSMFGEDSGKVKAKCIWFENTKIFEGIFPFETLTIFTEPDISNMLNNLKRNK